ncbi:multifunctional methyltransferase subunit TRM112 homolog A [Brachypodium distachyon]|uniref:Trm112p-like protein n=1 Tax=Brachypodium distachyon TaxID=15368 RepID=I1GSB7_BRADI|nr:multifunctional methyltransferase subunit TRM112 homolog A [Brachypodium distachyon]KQK15230.1 hypothetical protein BRADI_1g21366v3 [Brachypodium distachyon]|eukprot:XP_003562689.1 multifunctional methyltransferase subunit TRM112 homolog A [Brachypodium distachyon]
MRLLTHNFLASNMKGVSTGYPLGLEVVKSTIKEVELNADFLRGILPKLDWRALAAATSAAGYPDLLPAEQPSEAEFFAEGAAEFEDSPIRRLHRALLEIHIDEGTLVCPESGRTFPIQKGVPNMILHEDEVRA